MLKISNRFFILVAGIVFLGEGMLHGFRAYSQSAATIGFWEIPLWASWSIAGLGFVLAITALRILK